MLMFTLILILADSVFGQLILPGKCPDLQPVENFEASKWMGKWYEAERYFFIPELGVECLTETFYLNDDGTLTFVKIAYDHILSRNISLSGKLTFDESPAVAKFTGAYLSLPVPVPSSIRVIGTDYAKYAVVWGCVDIGFLNARIVWILTREQTPNSSTLNEAYAVFDEFGISKLFLLKNLQENC